MGKPEEADDQRKNLKSKAEESEKHEHEHEKLKAKTTFVDAAAMKEKVRLNLMKPKIVVSDFYHETGVFQAIARSVPFERVTLTVITLNAIWIAVDTDWNDSAILLTADPVFIVAENFFCFFFVFEWFVRFMAFKQKRNGLKDGWFCFDSCMVMMMVAETWLFTLILFCLYGNSMSEDEESIGNGGIMSLARLLRLSRMARMGKLLRVMPEMMIMLKGMRAATRSVAFTLLLLAIITFMFAIASTQLSAGTELGVEYFSWVPNSMYTLLIFGILLDNVGILSAPMRESPALLIMFFAFVLIGALTVMNMLVGVLCEVVSAVAATEQEEMRVTFVHEKLERVMNILDRDASGTISKREFVQILGNYEAVKCLNDVGVDVFALIDLADYIFEDDTATHEEIELDFSKFMEVVLQLRGSNNATVKDIVDLRKFMRQTMVENYKGTMKVLEKLEALESRVAGSSGKQGRQPKESKSELQTDLEIIRKSLKEVGQVKHSDLLAARCDSLISLSSEKMNILSSWDPVDEAPEFRIPLESEIAGVTSAKDGNLWGKQSERPGLQLPTGRNKASFDTRGPQDSHARTQVVDGIVITGIPSLKMDNWIEEAQAEALQQQMTEICRQLVISMNDSIEMLGHSLERRVAVGASTQVKENRL